MTSVSLRVKLNGLRVAVQICFKSGVILLLLLFTYTLFIYCKTISASNAHSFVRWFMLTLHLNFFFNWIYLCVGNLFLQSHNHLQNMILFFMPIYNYGNLVKYEICYVTFTVITNSCSFLPVFTRLFWWFCNFVNECEKRKVSLFCLLF